MQDDDDNLFRDAMRDVRPLKTEQRVIPYRHKPAPRALRQEQDDQQVIKDMLSDPVELADIETGDELLFCRPEIAQKTFKKLRRGEWAVEAELDLHGKKVDDARGSLAQFLTFSYHHNLRCVRIIHGKGHGSRNKQPVLKTHVNYWLRQRNEILAFCSCRPVDGGTGAIYVLLRKYKAPA